MAVGDAYEFPGFLTPVLTQLSFPKPPNTLLNAFAKVRGENTPERKVASTGDRTDTHQVTSPTSSPLSHPGGANTQSRHSHLQYTTQFTWAGLIHSQDIHTYNIPLSHPGGANTQSRHSNYNIPLSSPGRG